MQTTELAWAAGVFDGEGSASVYLPKGRRSLARQIAVYQAGRDGPPPLLVRFRAAVGDLGLVHGPARGYLYQWHSKRHPVVDEVTILLWPWLGEAKRAQLARCAIAVGRPVPSTDERRVDREEAAWAAGFFDGEGTAALHGDPRRPAIGLSIAQASVTGVPPALVRFRDAVGAGSIHGPRLVPSPWSKLPQYRWELTRFAEVERVVELLRPHLDGRKRAQTERCLELVRGVRGSRAREA